MAAGMLAQLLEGGVPLAPGQRSVGPIRWGRQMLHFVTNRRPTHSGIDPYNLYIDRNSGDNVGSVTG